jgi:hypothetical protein
VQAGDACQLDMSSATLHPVDASLNKKPSNLDSTRWSKRRYLHQVWWCPTSQSTATLCRSVSASSAFAAS